MAARAHLLGIQLRYTLALPVLKATGVRRAELNFAKGQRDVVYTFILPIL